MTSSALLIIYLGLGAALGLLRLTQGLKGMEAALCGLAWPLELLAGWLGLLHVALRERCRLDEPYRS